MNGLVKCHVKVEVAAFRNVIRKTLRILKVRNVQYVLVRVISICGELCRGCPDFTLFIGLTRGCLSELKTISMLRGD